METNNNNNKATEKRLDLDIYIMGEMRYEFMSFLSDCFNEKFVETLSWGNFRRFQLILSKGKNWMNVHFYLLKNEMSADVLINSFKIYENRNITLLFYNVNDNKSEKQIEALYDSLIFERDKLFDGILNDESLSKNMKKIYLDSNNTNSTNNLNNTKINNEEIKNNLKFLTEKDENLIYKIGFWPNNTNKKTKNVKKNDNTTYDIENKIFFIDDEEGTDFYGLMKFLLIENAEKLKIGNIEIFERIININPKIKNVLENEKPKKDLIDYFVKIIDWLIVFYICTCAAKFIFDT
jgi:hypothetical protein